MQDRREVRYALRLPPDLHAALVEMARHEERSLNQQIIYVLRQAVRRNDRGARKRSERSAPAPARHGPGLGEPDQLRGGPQ